MITEGAVFGRWLVISGAELIRQRRYYHCLCECGEVRLIAGSKLTNGTTSSCGCSRIGMPFPSRRRADASFNSIVSIYKTNAKKKGQSFNLTPEHMRVLLAGSCAYCGSPPNQIRYKELVDGTEEFLYNGIDRLNNEYGYEPDNVVSCCRDCNFKKGAQDADAFIEWVLKVAANLQRIQP